MTAKEYLSQAVGIKIRLEAMAEQLEHLKSAAGYVGVRYSHLPKPATPNIHKSEDAIIRVIEMENRMNAEFIRLADISRVIASVSDPTSQTLLVKRYLKGKTWQEISCEMYFSICHIYRLHNAALAEVERVIANESK